MTERPKPLPAVPAELRALVRSESPDRLLVRTQSGGEVSVDIAWFEVEGFTLLRGGRFLAVRVAGYEEYGHILVDRAGTGAVHDTGAVPTFSPDGRWFAAAELTDFGFSNLEGVALWEVTETTSRRLFFTDAVPYGFDWAVDGWVRPDCVAISAGISDAPQGTRSRYEIELAEGGAAMRTPHGREPCREYVP